SSARMRRPSSSVAPSAPSFAEVPGRPASGGACSPGVPPGRAIAKPRPARGAGSVPMARSGLLVAIAMGPIGCVGVQAVVDPAIADFQAVKPEARLLGWTVDEKRERRRLAPELRVVRAQLDVVIRERFAATVHLVESGGSI